MNPLVRLTSQEKSQVFAEVEIFLSNLHFDIQARDTQRPWGGFFVIRESQSKQFAKNFFPEMRIEDLYMGGKLSPKILVVQPLKRLSWQYHHRRAEIWKSIGATVGVMTSASDAEGDTKELGPGEIIRLKQGERHRLIGRSEWGVVAEIWQHTDAAHPSDEDDIVRLQDDFGR
jgi:mannose-6-phosphate isomerase